MRVLVTGAAGFIGSSVAEALLRRRDEVVGIDNFNSFYDPSIKEENAREVAKTAAAVGAKFELIRADLVTDDERVDALFTSPATRPDVILHLAAWAGVRPSIRQPLVYTANNVEATTKLLERARRFE
ncbi:MAG: GDP-mannose 4,6-dehydratase, partial [Myxococcota bacterium]